MRHNPAGGQAKGHDYFILFYSCVTIVGVTEFLIMVVDYVLTSAINLQGRFIMDAIKLYPFEQR